MHYPTIESTLGHTPRVRLQRLNAGLPPEVTVLCKMEGDNPAGSVKDRAAFYMIQGAQERGEIQPGDHLIEATSGNTGIALAMVGAILGYRMTLIMPDNLSDERKRAMTAYGAELILVSEKEGMEGARDLALQMETDRKGRVLNQFANPDCPRAHYETTGPEIWKDTDGSITHFVSAMGTTGTIMGVSRYLKEQNPNIKIIGLNRVMVQRSRGFVVGRLSTVQKSSIHRALMSPWISIRKTRKTWPDSSLSKKEFSVVSAPVERYLARCASRVSSLTVLWFVLFVIVVTAIFRRTSSRDESTYTKTRPTS